MKPLLTPGWNGTDRYDDYWLYLVARRHAGYSLRQSRDALNGAYRGILELQASTLHMNAKAAGELLASKLELQDGSRGNSNLRDNSRTPILILIGATVMVLLIAMANTANLLLARSAQRRKELAIRAAIGASRGELMGQLLTEALLLAAGGALAGLAIASVTLSFLVAQMGDGDTPVQFLTTQLGMARAPLRRRAGAFDGPCLRTLPRMGRRANFRRRNHKGRSGPGIVRTQRVARAARARMPASHDLRRAADTHRPVSEESGEPDGSRPRI